MCTGFPIGRLFLGGTVERDHYFAISGEFTSVSKRAGVEDVLKSVFLCVLCL